MAWEVLHLHIVIGVKQVHLRHLEVHVLGVVLLIVFLNVVVLRVAKDVEVDTPVASLHPAVPFRLIGTRTTP